MARVWAVVERARAEEALRASEVKYRTLFDSIDEGFCTFDMLFDDAGVPIDYRFVEYNPAFERHTGLTGAVGQTVREFLPDQDRHWFEIYGRVAMTGEPVRVTRYGEALKRWIEVYAFRIGEPEQRRVAALFSDVTVRKEAELSLQASEEQQAFLVAQDNRRRDWTDREIALLREVSERTWATVERARAERARRDGEARFRLAIEGSKITLFECDAGLRYTWMANPVGGFEVAKIVGRKDEEFVPSEEAPKLIDFKTRALASKVPLEEELDGTPAGIPRTFLMRAEKMLAPSGESLGLRVLAGAARLE